MSMMTTIKICNSSPVLQIENSQPQREQPSDQSNQNSKDQHLFQDNARQNSTNSPSNAVFLSANDNIVQPEQHMLQSDRNSEMNNFPKNIASQDNNTENSALPSAHVDDDDYQELNQYEPSSQELQIKNSQQQREQPSEQSHQNSKDQHLLQDITRQNSSNSPSNAVLLSANDNIIQPEQHMLQGDRNSEINNLPKNISSQDNNTANSALPSVVVNLDSPPAYSEHCIAIDQKDIIISKKQLHTHMTLSRFTFMYCFPLLGSLAIIYSIRTEDALAKGENNKAKEFSRSARNYALSSIMVGTFFTILIATIMSYLASDVEFQLIHWLEGIVYIFIALTFIRVLACLTVKCWLARIYASTRRLNDRHLSSNTDIVVTN